MLTLEYRSIDSIRPYERNAKVHSKKQLEMIAESIRRLGFRNPLVVDADGVIVAGHGRWEAAKLAGLQEVPCVDCADLSPDEVNAYRLLDNKLAESPWDYDILSLELPTVDLSGFDLKWNADLELPAELTESSAEPEPCGFDISRGDMFRLGDHILLCGDATDKADVERLMGGTDAQLLLTDPPYNCDYHGTVGTILNDAQPPERFRTFLVDALANAKAHMLPGAAFFIWYGALASYEFFGACKDVGLTVRQVLVWIKNRTILSRSDFNWQHEQCVAGDNDIGGEGISLYGWTDGGSHKFYKSAKQSTALFYDAPVKSELHPTMKPLDMIGYQIHCVTRPGDVVLDLFGGSGTTLIACEKLGRVCRMMELDPKYCRAIIERFEKETGGKAEAVV